MGERRRELAFLLTAGAASAQVVDQKGLTLEAAKRVIATAVAEARPRDAPPGARRPPPTQPDGNRRSL